MGINKKAHGWQCATVGLGADELITSYLGTDNLGANILGTDILNTDILNTDIKCSSLTVALASPVLILTDLIHFFFSFLHFTCHSINLDFNFFTIFGFDIEFVR